MTFRNYNTDIIAFSLGLAVDNEYIRGRVRDVFPDVPFTIAPYNNIHYSGQGPKSWTPSRRCTSRKGTGEQTHNFSKRHLPVRSIAFSAT